MEMFPAAAIISLLLYLLYKFLYRKSDQNCYLLGYQCYKAPDELKASAGTSAKIALRNKNLGLEEYRFLVRTMIRSGIGEETYIPRNFLEGREASPTLQDSLDEMTDATFSNLDALFATSAVRPCQIDILVTTGSLFAPVPSLSSRIVHRYKMREGIKCFSLTGMGCSSSVIAVDLVRHTFRTRPNSFAVVVAVELTAPNWYTGQDRSMMLSNVLFRAGGSSLLLTNHPSWKDRAIMKLEAVVRNHVSTDEAYECAIHVEDEQGYPGARLTKSLPTVAMRALEGNLRVLLPKVLPLWEILRFVVASYRWRIVKGGGGDSKPPPPVMNMRTGIQHFCLHTGGRAVIDGFEKSFGLREYDMEPSRMTLHRFGNTSCSSLWYVLGYMEAKKRLKRGDSVMMVGLGAGFLCNTCVWTVMRDLEDGNVWADCVDRYPPPTAGNRTGEILGWIFDDCMSFINFKDYDRAVLFSR
ncbi:unnamed protein product [Linum tenue]|uniref:3-ketoacyl-CoA synthase n=5 Tax=Linum tenue TaxID=586396 RepID=A0AAV0MRK7_9ROSI|nr:unnamed protein product [Linum tenue]